MSIRDRLRRLEDRFRDRGPSLEELQTAFARIAENAKAKLRGKPVDRDQRARDREIVDSWAQAEGVDLEGEAQRAYQTLADVGSREQ